MARKDHDNISNFFENGLDIDHRTLYLGSAGYTVEGEETGIDFFMVEKFIKGIHLCETLAPNGDKPIKIYMNNIGGHVIHGMAIYDAIKACKNHTTIIVFGNVCSMGSYILQAANTRLLSANSVFMFHEGYDGYGTNHPRIIDNWREFFKTKYNKVLDNILLEAINKKKFSEGKKLMKEKEFEELNKFDKILTAEEAVDWGFADAILDKI